MKILDFVDNFFVHLPEPKVVPCFSRLSHRRSRGLSTRFSQVHLIVFLGTKVYYPQKPSSPTTYHY